jgi:hypothetical protein
MDGGFCSSNRGQFLEVGKFVTDFLLHCAVAQPTATPASFLDFDWICIWGAMQEPTWEFEAPMLIFGGDPFERAPTRGNGTRGIWANFIDLDADRVFVIVFKIVAAGNRRVARLAASS